MVGIERKTNILDEKATERRACTSFRMFSESNSLKDGTETALALNGSPRRCLVFKVFTLEFDACHKLLLPVALPVQSSEKGIHMSPEVCGNLDNLKQPSPIPSILFKFDPQKEQMIHMADCGTSAKAFVVSGSSRENATRQPRKKNKRCKSVKNFSTLSLQSSVLHNFSSCLICNGSNLVIHSALANRNSTVSKPIKRNLKKTNKKEEQYKRLLHWKGSAASGNVSEESVCESSVTSIPSSTEDIYRDVLSEEPALNSRVVKVFPMEKIDNDVRLQSSVAVKPYVASVKHISSTSEIDVSEDSEQIAAASDEFAWEDLGCNQNIDECFSADETSERAISTSRRSTCTDNLGDVSLYSSSSSNNALVLDTVLDNGTGAITACSTVDVESHLFIDKGGRCSYVECATANNSLQDIGPPQCITPNSCRTNYNKPCDDSCNSEDFALAYNIDDRPRCSTEASSSCTSIAFSPTKRGRNSRKITEKFNALHKFGNTNAYARTRKEANHSVWQRVQKNIGQESIYELKDPNSFSLQHDYISQVNGSRVEDNASLWSGQRRHDELLDDDPISMKMLKGVVGTSKHLPKSSGKLVSKMPEKLKTKSLLVPKQGLRKESQNSKNDSAHLVKKKKNCAVGSSSMLDTNTQRSDVHPTEKASSFRSKPWVKEEVHANEMAPTPNINDVTQKIGSYVAQNDINLLARTLDSMDMKCIPEASCDTTTVKLDEDMRHSFCHLAGKRSAGRKPETGGAHAEHSKQDNNSLPVLQKWVPVGKRAENRSKSKNVSSESVDCFSSEMDSMTDKSQYNPHHMHKDHVSPDFCFSQEEAVDGGTFSFETDLNKINLGVKEAYKLQIASETFQRENSSPLTEYERLLYSASPMLCQMLGIPSCKYCSQDQLIGDTLCQHQVPNISLRNLWQWYEKPGNYGLEVKVEDHLNPKRSGIDTFDFRAYFVPYLSAVQLFGLSARCTCRDSCISDDKINKAHEADSKPQTSSQVISLPMFSLLVPPPRKEVVNQVLDPSLSSFPNDEACDRAICKKCLMAQALLFEYFECDQPQMRRPLFEKIKELTKGNSISNSPFFGDPFKLECLNLHDLHPASWFSVAWYPIYRIPDGSFRASFLTYHCLGHFTHRDVSVKSADGVSHIVSPVVGLQSYNAKGECWFRQRGSSSTAAAQTEGFTSLLPSEIFKERLRTLETTAAVMSRASVPKGGQTSVNRHPDYEFFLSRSAQDRPWGTC